MGTGRKTPKGTQGSARASSSSTDNRYSRYSSSYGTSDARRSGGAVDGESYINPRIAKDVTYAHYNDADSYAQARVGAHKSSAGRTFAKILAVLIVVLIAVGFWYNAQLTSNMAFPEPQRSELAASLTPKGYGEPCYTLIVGSDSRTGTSGIAESMYSDGQGRTDIMILVRTDPANHVVTMVSIPRDTQVEIDGSIRKINQALSLGGPALTVEKVEDVTGVKVSHFIEVGFLGVADFVDALGGITVDVPQAISGDEIISGGKVSLDAGPQTLDGAEAVFFARQRHAYGDNQDMARQSNVRLVMNSIMDEVASRPLYDMPATFLDLSKCLKSNLNVLDFIQLGVGFGAQQPTIYSCTGPFNGAQGIVEGTDEWFCYLAPNEWETLMAVVDAGQDPSEVNVLVQG